MEVKGLDVSGRGNEFGVSDTEPRLRGLSDMLFKFGTAPERTHMPVLSFVKDCPGERPVYAVAGVAATVGVAGTLAATFRAFGFGAAFFATGAVFFSAAF